MIWGTVIFRGQNFGIALSLPLIKWTHGANTDLLLYILGFVDVLYTLILCHMDVNSMKERLKEEYGSMCTWRRMKKKNQLDMKGK